ncbi:MAG: hypothetical protein KAT25_05775 [Sulfuriflexus sp.]|nr:hypothetical protein [Sulfuriflexus sp.]
MLKVFLALFPIVVPLFYFLFYAHDIFGLPRISVLIYIASLAIGFMYWPPLAIGTLVLAWVLMIGSWAWLIWQIFRQP